MKSATLMMCSLLCLYFLSALIFLRNHDCLEMGPKCSRKETKKKKIQQINLGYCDHIVYYEDKKSGRTPLFKEKDLRTFCSEM